MLYFTFHDGHTKGLYNGRFAFQSSFDISNIDDLVMSVELSENDKFDKALAHEHAHRIAFAESYLGWMIVGMRFFARIWMATNKENKVIAYYKLRTTYFLLSYAVHEKIVDDILVNKKLKYQQIQEIKKTDAQIKSVLINLNILPAIHFRAIFTLLGYLAHKAFSVAAIYENENGTTEGIIISSRKSFFGAFNSVYGDNSKDGFIIKSIKYLYQIINIENVLAKMGKTTDDDMIIAWCALKFWSEYKHIKQLKNANPSIYSELLIDDLYDDYVANIILFVYSYNRISSNKNINEYVNAVEELTHPCFKNSPIPPKKLKHVPPSIAGFFYLHGN